MSWSSAVLASSPYLWWRLGEASGTVAADSSGNGRDGAIANMTLGVASLVPSDATDTAMTVDNANDQVSLASMSYSGLDFTAMMVVKSTATSGGIFAAGSTTRLTLGAPNMSGLVNNNTITLTPSYPTASLFDGNAHLVVWKVGATTAELWVDGTMVASGTHSIGAVTLTSFQLKRGSNNPASGTFDEMALWTRNLTSTEIGDLYTAYLGGATTVNGSQATETDTAPAGASTVGKIIVGSQATETDTAQAGVIGETVAGSQATETDTAQAGSASVGQAVAGSQAEETDTAPAGATVAGAVVPGSQATETDTAQAGTVATGEVAVGSQAAETDTAQAGATAVGAVVSGAQASETDTAQAGSTTTSSTVTGSQAEETDTAQAGTVDVADPMFPIDLSTYIDFFDSMAWNGTYLVSNPAGGYGDFSFQLSAVPVTTYSVEVDYEVTTGGVGFFAVYSLIEPTEDGATSSFLYSIHTTTPALPVGTGTLTFDIGPGIEDWDLAVAAGEEYLQFSIGLNVRITGIRTSSALVDQTPPGAVGDTSNAANALVLGGWAVATWEPAVVPRPLIFGQQSIYAVAYGVPVMSGTMPTYPMSEARKPRWRQRILMGGRDITFERGVPTPDVEFQLADPLLYGPGTIALPQISATREWGKSWLPWLGKRKRVRVQLVDDNDVVQATPYKGFVMAPSISGADLTLQTGGEAQGRAIMRDKQVPVFRDVLDLSRILWRALTDLGLRSLPRLGEPGTGIRSLNFGGTGMLEHIEEGIARATKRDGTQRTVMPDADGVYRLIDKDTETVHWTLFLDETITIGDLHSDIAEEPNRIYATTIDPNGMRVNFAAVPGIVQGPTPDYPMVGGANFGIGTTNEDTIDGDGISVMVNRLGAVGLLDIRDTPGGFDEDVEDALARLQRRAGLTGPVGVMTPALWDALWDLDVTGTDKSWSSIQPAAQHDSVRRYDRSGNGGIMGLNDSYDESILPVDLTVDMGSGFTGNQAERFSEHLVHDPATDDWYGTITSRGGAVLIGQVDEGATLTPEMLADGRMVRPVENLWVPNFAGGTLFHIAAIDVKADSIRYTVDTRAKPARDVWERIKVRKETRRNPIRGWLGTRQSNTQKDAVQGFLSFGGMVDRNVNLEPGWNVIEVILGDYGTIAWLQTVVQTVQDVDGDIIITPREYALALFGKHVTEAKLNDILPAPLAEDGDRPWRRGASRTYLKSRWDLYSAGTFKEPCGYGTDFKTDGATLTGEHMDEGGFRYKTDDGVTGYLAVWVENEATLMRGRVVWPLLEGGV